MVTKYDKNMLLKFKQYLDKIHYHLILTIILGEGTYFVNPLPEYSKVKFELKKLDVNSQKLFSFFLLGEPLEKDILEYEMDKKLIEYLYEIKIINQDNIHYWMNNYVLTSYCNCYFLVSNVSYYPTNQSQEQKPYIGIDTYWLSRIITNTVNGNVLDLCTGSGIQAILAAKTADAVVAVDIDQQSANIALFNACLNNLSDKIDVRIGNLYEVVKDNENFDFIISNPPFIPIPNDVNFHICGDGGEQGTIIVNKILSGYSSYLTPGGQGIMIGQCIGTNETTFIEGSVNDYLSDMETSVIISEKTMIESQAKGFAELASKYNGHQISPQKWMEIYKQIGAEYFYSFTLFAVNQKGTHKKLSVRDRWSKNEVPESCISNFIKCSEIFNVKNINNQCYVLDDESVAFLNLVDGQKTLEELVNCMPFKYRIRYGNLGDAKQMNKFSMLCSLYERQGLIKPALNIYNKS